MENSENRHFVLNGKVVGVKRKKELVIEAKNMGMQVSNYNVLLNDRNISELIKEQLGEVKFRADVTIIIKEVVEDITVIKNDFKGEEVNDGN